MSGLLPIFEYKVDYVEQDLCHAVVPQSTLQHIIIMLANVSTMFAAHELSHMSDRVLWKRYHLLKPEI
jgi:hypothetical protein